MRARLPTAGLAIVLLLGACAEDDGESINPRIPDPPAPVTTPAP